MIQLKRAKEIIDFLTSLTEEERNVLQKIQLVEEKIGYKRKYVKVSEEDLRLAKKLIQNGNNLSAVARATGINYSTLKNKIKKGLM